MAAGAGASGRDSTGEIATRLPAPKPVSERAAGGCCEGAPRVGTDTTSVRGTTDGPTDAAGAVAPPSTGTVVGAATGSEATLGATAAPESDGAPASAGVLEAFGRPESDGLPTSAGEPESVSEPPAFGAPLRAVGAPLSEGVAPLRENVVDVGLTAAGRLTFG